MKLSNHHFPWMFESRHHDLALKLEKRASAIDSKCNGSAENAHSALAEAKLYPHLIPIKGKHDLRGLCMIREMLAANSVQADSIFAVQGLGTTPIFLFGNETQKDSVARGLIEGEIVAGFGLTEPEAGSDVASLQCAAKEEKDCYVLSGQKTFISNAGLATHYTVFATTDSEKGKDGICAFWVPADAPGLVVEELKTSVDHPLGSLHFDNCNVPASALIGREGQGFAIAMATLDKFRLTVGAAAIGMARKAISVTRAHAQGRKQFGRPLASQPVVRSMLATMATDFDAAVLLVLRAARLKDEDKTGERSSVETAMAKLFATEAASRIIDTAVQLHGGKGVLEGEVVEELYRAIRPLRIYEGATEIQRLIIGRAVTKGEWNP